MLDEGLQEVLYSPAPGNKTEKSFAFSLNLNPLSGSFLFGGKLCVNSSHHVLNEHCFYS